MGNTAEQNLGMGAIFETRLLGGYLVSSGGRTLGESLNAMTTSLAMYAHLDRDLPRDTRAMKFRRAARWLNPLRPLKWWHHRRRMAAVTHPVRELVRHA